MVHLMSPGLPDCRASTVENPWACQVFGQPVLPLFSSDGVLQVKSLHKASPATPGSCRLGKG